MKIHTITKLAALLASFKTSLGVHAEQDDDIFLNFIQDRHWLLEPSKDVLSSIVDIKDLLNDVYLKDIFDDNIGISSTDTYLWHKQLLRRANPTADESDVPCGCGQGCGYKKTKADLRNNLTRANGCYLRDKARRKAALNGLIKLGQGWVEAPDSASQVEHGEDSQPTLGHEIQPRCDKCQSSPSPCSSCYNKLWRQRAKATGNRGSKLKVGQKCATPGCERLLRQSEVNSSHAICNHCHGQRQAENKRKRKETEDQG